MFPVQLRAARCGLELLQAGESEKLDEIGSTTGSLWGTGWHRHGTAELQSLWQVRIDLSQNGVRHVMHPQKKDSPGWGNCEAPK